MVRALRTTHSLDKVETGVKKQVLTRYDFITFVETFIIEMVD